MSHVSFVFCLHNHQPEGNFDAVFRQATRDAYRPFLDLLLDRPALRCSMHCSGILLQWFERNDPETFAVLDTVVRRGQLELLGGGFHEPILPAIPDADKRGQLEKMTAYIDARFGVRVRGMWLAERVWEQHLVRDIRDAGLTFTVLDDTHFLAAGIPESRLSGYYVTEEQGRQIAVFPISKPLRYLIPFGAVEETLEHLYTVAHATPHAIAVYADDGEKFGVWPRTREHVWEHGWLLRFFDALERNADWLHVKHFSEVLADHPAMGRVYLPNASYAEMMHWSLPDPSAYRSYEQFEHDLRTRGELDAVRGFVRGGFWRNFMVKYPEVNDMHKSMQRVSERAHAVRAAHPDAPAVAQALDHLWAAQCNCPYWHGVFGGLYLPHIRAEVYRNLLSAERLLDEVEGKNRMQVMTSDVDADGHEEILVHTPHVTARFHPALGASLHELGFKDATFNVLDILTRREEGYHRQLGEARVSGGDGESRSIHDGFSAKEAGLADRLVVDRYRRGSFIEHCLSEMDSIDDFARMTHEERGDFIGRDWTVSVDADEHAARLFFVRHGSVMHAGTSHPLTIEKHITVTRGMDPWRVTYRLRGGDHAPASIRFGVEFCAALLSGDAPDRYIEIHGASVIRVPGGATGSVADIHGCAFVNEWDGYRLSLSWDRPAELWHCPIDSISLSEDGFERTNQGSMAMPVWSLDLTDEVILNLELSLQRIGP